MKQKIIGICGCPNRRTLDLCPDDCSFRILSQKVARRLGLTEEKVRKAQEHLQSQDPQVRQLGESVLLDVKIDSQEMVDGSKIPEEYYVRECSINKNRQK